MPDVAGLSSADLLLILPRVEDRVLHRALPCHVYELHEAAESRQWLDVGNIQKRIVIIRWTKHICNQRIVLQVKTNFIHNTSLVLDMKADSFSSAAASTGPVLVLTARPGSRQSSRGMPNSGAHVGTGKDRAQLRAMAGQQHAAMQLPANRKLPADPAAARALHLALPAATLQGGLKELSAARATGEGHAALKVHIPFVRKCTVIQAGLAVSHL